MRVVITILTLAHGFGAGWGAAARGVAWKYFFRPIVSLKPSASIPRMSSMMCYLSSAFTVVERMP
jgi:hypothetical protein